VRQEKRYPIPVPAVEPSNGFSERRGVSPPVFHPPASATIVEVPTGSLETGSRNLWVVFPCPPPKRAAKVAEELSLSDTPPCGPDYAVAGADEFVRNRINSIDRKSTLFSDPSIGVDERSIDQMLGDEPNLCLIRPNNIAD